MYTDLMKNFSRIQLLSLIIAIILGAFITRTETRYNTMPCALTAGCGYSNQELGNLSTRKQGFPLAYKELVTFQPTQNNRYAETSMQLEQDSGPTIIVNTIFWFALLELIRSYYKMFRKPKRK
jgi:hypothetical protein